MLENLIALAILVCLACLGCGWTKKHDPLYDDLDDWIDDPLYDDLDDWIDHQW